MKAFLITTAMSTILATSAFAQTTAPKAPATPTPGMTDAAETRFKAADKDNNGSLTGEELASYKTVMPRIDTDKDGAVSRGEFAAAVKSGVIK